VMKSRRRIAPSGDYGLTIKRLKLAHSKGACRCRSWINRDRSGRPYSPIDVRFAPNATEIARHCNMSRRAMSGKVQRAV
jgi:hypothetical protein